MSDLFDNSVRIFVNDKKSGKLLGHSIVPIASNYSFTEVYFDVARYLCD